jgi:hypothetical protein
MKFKTVTYQHAVVTGPYLQDKIGFEIELEKGDTPKGALSEAKKIAEEWHEEHNTLTVVASNHLPEINLADERELIKLEDLLNEKKNRLQDYEIFFAERVIKNKEKESYLKLGKMLQFA